MDLVQIAFAQNEIEAEMIQGLLGDSGIPSATKPSGMVSPGQNLGDLRMGFRGGSQYVMVQAAREGEARALLAETLAPDEGAEWPELANARHLERAGGGGHGPRNYGSLGATVRTLAVAVIFFAVAFGVFELLRAV